MLSRIRSRFQSNSDDEDQDEGLRNRVARKLNSRRPPNTAFRQQRLKAWQPILTPRVVIPMMIIMAIIFIPIGLGFLLTSYKVNLISIDYTNCDEVESEYVQLPNKHLKWHLDGSKESIDIKWKYNSNENKCYFNINIPEGVESKDWFLYYKLTNFYQNHRKYVSSYDWNQLKGEAVPLDQLNCNGMESRDGKIIYPCGLVANSMFNDTISNLNIFNNDNSGESINWSSNDIAWSSDVKLYKTSKYNINEILPPLNWIEKYPNGYSESDLEFISSDERFMNWMKTAALPSFLKLYGKGKGMKSGNYEMSIELNYPVSIFGGTKSIVLSTSSIFGGRHLALGVVYLVVGGLSVLFCVVFAILAMGKKRRSHEFLNGL
ncbi:hypothetical protein DAMA08_031640 [Martiniozyma asiatica (nom. inval.)]|nr:hypothetical protein DAMA08_031640 [Martiniozyma asiatica]